jgi:hypothetical protein
MKGKVSPTTKDASQFIAGWCGWGFLRTRRIYSPSPLVLDRFIGNIAKDALRTYEAENIHRISNTIGKELISLFCCSLSGFNLCDSPVLH